MSAITTTHLDHHQRAAMTALANQLHSRSALTTVRDYHDQLTKAPRPVLVAHLLLTAARIARHGLTGHLLGPHVRADLAAEASR